MDDDMDIDLDYEDEQVVEMKATLAKLEEGVEEIQEAERMMTVVEPLEEGEVDAIEVQPTKIHISGLDRFDPKDLRDYIEQHFSLDNFRRIQWVNDSSANLVFDSEESARDALLAFANVEEEDPVRNREAKPLSRYPDTPLEVRMATISDVKVENAALQSTFYLRNPEYDPEVRNHRRRDRRDDRRDYRRGGINRPRRDNFDSERSPREPAPFDVNLYDDAPSASAQNMERRGSERSQDSAYGRRKVIYEAPANNEGRLRDRSASPQRNGHRVDGRYGFDEVEARRAYARYRSRSPPRYQQRGINDDSMGGFRRELFPGKQGSSPARGNISSNNQGRELFPNKVSARPEQIADNLGKSNPRDVDRPSNNEPFSRTDRTRLNDEPRDLMSRMTGGPVSQSRISGQYTAHPLPARPPGPLPSGGLVPSPRMSGANKYRREIETYRPTDRRSAIHTGREGVSDNMPHPREGKSNDLMSRINKGSNDSYGRLNSDDTEVNGYSFKGASNELGFSIRGASGKVNELFAPKIDMDNQLDANDLFAGRMIKGQGSKLRRRAEDY